MADALAVEVEPIAEAADLEAVAVAAHVFGSIPPAADWDVHGDRWFHAASTVKVAILVALAQAVTERRFDQMLPHLDAWEHER